MNKIYRVEDLDVYQEAFELQQIIFRTSKGWPREEMYSLTDQIRRSSRSIGANLSEAWAKRRYIAHFESKLSDSDVELQETRHWLRTAKACEYLSEEEAKGLFEQADEVGRRLGKMIQEAPSFCLPSH